MSALIEQIVNLAWEFRDMESHRFPTPPEDDCVRFAVQEGVEAMNVDLAKNKEYVRRKEHEVDGTVEYELATCAFMMASALGREFKGVLIARKTEDADLTASKLAAVAGRVLYDYEDGDPEWRVWAEMTIWMISFYPGMDLVKEMEGLFSKLRERLDKKEAERASRKVSDSDGERSG